MTEDFENDDKENQVKSVKTLINVLIKIVDSQTKYNELLEKRIAMLDVFVSDVVAKMDKLEMRYNGEFKFMKDKISGMEDDVTLLNDELEAWQTSPPSDEDDEEEEGDEDDEYPADVNEDGLTEEEYVKENQSKNDVKDVHDRD